MEKVDSESSEKTQKLKYPIGVFFVVYNGLSDRFAYYGIKAVLILYLTKMLLYNDDKATETYHLFFMFCTLIPLFGAAIADSFVGKFKTILAFTLVYLAGNSILTASAIPPLQLPREEFSILGLALLAIGTGCVKPCVVALGGDQYQLPEQEKQLSSYFSIFYFAISIGALVATFLAPIFRKDVSCFGDDCYSLVFASTTVMMITALVAFLIGKSFYKITTTDGSIIVQVTKCMTHAATAKYKKGKSSTELHWLDHAVSSGKFERNLVEDIKSVLKVLVLYLTFPMFWALMEQQGSRWTLQASGMNGAFFGFNIKPDHIQVINPLLVLALIPAFDRYLYPALAKFNLLKKPLQKLGVGGVLAAIAFVISGFIELHLEAAQRGNLQMANSSYSYLERDVKIINTIPYDVNATWTLDGNTIESGAITTNGSFTINSVHENFTMTFVMSDGQYYNSSEGNNFTVAFDDLKEDSRDSMLLLTLDDSTSKIQGTFENTTFYLTTQEPQITTDVHMLWLLPQYITITVAEVMFAVAGMEFSYSQAPSSMKSVMQSAWLVTIAVGNFIVAVVAKVKIFSDQSSEFFLFAVLMLGDMLVFMWLASNYNTRNGFKHSSVKSYREIVSLSLRDPEVKTHQRNRRHTTPA